MATLEELRNSLMNNNPLYPSGQPLNPMDLVKLVQQGRDPTQDTRGQLSNSNPAFIGNPIIEGIRTLLKSFAAPVAPQTNGSMDYIGKLVGMIKNKSASINPSQSILGDMSGLDSSNTPSTSPLINPNVPEGMKPPDPNLLLKVINDIKKGGGTGAKAAARLQSGNVNPFDTKPMEDYSQPPIDATGMPSLDRAQDDETFNPPPQKDPTWSDAFNYGKESEIDLPGEYSKIFSQGHKRWEDLPQYKPYTEGMHWSQALGDVLTRAGQRAAGYDPIALRDKIENQKRLDVKEHRDYDISMLDKDTQNQIKILEVKYNQQESKKEKEGKFLDSLVHANKQILNTPQFVARWAKFSGLTPDVAKDVLKGFEGKDGKLNIVPTDAEIQINTQNTLDKYNVDKLVELGFSRKEAEYRYKTNDQNHSSYLKRSYQMASEQVPPDTTAMANITKELQASIKFEQQFDPKELERQRRMKNLPAYLNLLKGDPEMQYRWLAGYLADDVSDKMKIATPSHKSTGGAEGPKLNPFQKVQAIAADVMTNPNDPAKRAAFDAMKKAGGFSDDTQPYELLTATGVASMSKESKAPEAGIPLLINRATKLTGDKLAKRVDEYNNNPLAKENINKTDIIPTLRSLWAKEIAQVNKQMKIPLSDAQLLDMGLKTFREGKTQILPEDIPVIVQYYSGGKGK